MSGTRFADGANDFDLLIGDRLVLHRRLNRRLVGDIEWIEFRGPATARKILGGLGNIDEYRIDLPTGAYLGSSLRLFNQATKKWSIHWITTPSLSPMPPASASCGSRVQGLIGERAGEGLLERAKMAAGAAVYRDPRTQGGRR